jgi:hypothetical protein
MSTTYRVDAMRVIFPSGKISEKHPERFATIHGAFSQNNSKLSITSKNITIVEAKSKEFSIDQMKGILTLPSGARGRKKVEGVSNSELSARLKAIREQ